MRPAPGCFPSSLALRVLSEDPRFLTASAASRKPAASRSACLLAAKSLQSCLTLCDPRDGSPPGSPVPGSLQAGTLEWVAMSFSNAGKGSRSVVSDPQRPHGLQPTRLLHPRDFPGKSTGVGAIAFSDQYSILTHIYGDGEGNGTPLQYSCLENPMDGGAC